MRGHPRVLHRPRHERAIGERGERLVLVFEADVTQCDERLPSDGLVPERVIDRAGRSSSSSVSDTKSGV